MTGKGERSRCERTASLAVAEEASEVDSEVVSAVEDLADAVGSVDAAAATWAVVEASAAVSEAAVAALEAGLVEEAMLVPLPPAATRELDLDLVP